MDELTAPDVPGFLVGRVLGRGGSSTVWLVTEERTGRDFALKCLGAVAGRYALGRDAGLHATDQEDVRREIRILSVLDHQHLIQAHDALRIGWPAGPAPGRCGIGLLLDYAPGGSLAELVGTRSKLSIGETVTVLTPIAQVLGYLHCRGFTHGDVSPGNVLFTGHGKPMLSDLGIARMVGDAATVPDHGTAGFMDPSPVDAVRAGLQPERDVYAVAALGWYCLTGEPPRRTADRPPLSLLLPDVPADLAAALEAGLHEDRRLRPTAVEFATAVYRSAPPLPVDLASSVHSTVIPQLLTRRRTPDRPGGAVRTKLQAWLRRISTSRWSRLVGARQVLPFPQDPGDAAPEPRTEVSTAVITPEHAAQGVRRLRPGRHAVAGGRAGTLVLAAGAGAVLAGAIWAAAAFGPGGPGESPAGAGGLAVSAGESTHAVNGGSGESGAGASGPAVELIPAAVAAQLDSPDPLEAVRGLAAVRSLAFSSGRFELLELINVPGSAASAADGRIKGELQASGRILTGFTSTVEDLDLQPGSPPGHAIVGVTSATSSYQERDRSGAVVAAAGPAAGQKLRLVLVSSEGRWQITDVLPGT